MDRLRRFWPLSIILLGSFIGLMVILQSDPMDRDSADHHHADEAAEEAHGHHHGDEDGEEASDLDMSVSQVLASECGEHGGMTVDCTECRYEVGVVKVDGSLFEGNGAAEDFALVRSIRVATGRTDISLDATGEVQLNQNRAAHISPRIPGIIRSVKVDIGAEVNKGDILFEIDSVELGQAEGEYEKANSLVELALKNYQREKSFYERKIASERELIDAQMAYEQYRVELKAARRKLLLFGLDSKQIDRLGKDDPDPERGRLPMRAPFDGTVISRHAVLGELVEPGKEVMLLADISRVWIWADIYEPDLARLIEKRSEGKIPVEVVVKAFPDRTFTGEIDYLAPVMEEQTRTVKVRIEVNNSQRLLRPGMFCRIRIPLNSREGAVIIPKSGLLSDEGRDFVFKHLKDDYYIRRPVTRGFETDGRIEVLAGLTVGETIIAEGAFLLKSDVLREKLGAGCAD
jgi:cobalt-zinc-cadmium efflux system membrane fusion protein